MNNTSSALKNNEIINKKENNKMLENTSNTNLIPSYESGLVATMPLSTANLISNQLYQRDIDRKKIEMIIANFNPHKFGTIKVSCRNSKYYVFDGQHRLMALKSIYKGQDTTVQCEVHFGLTYEDEARLFAGQYDGSTRVDITYQTKALYEAGDETITKLKSLVESTGLKVSFSKAKQDNMIIAISKLKKMYRELSNEDFIRVLTLIKDTWKGISTSLDTEILGGMLLYYQTYKNEIVDKTFIKNLTQFDPVLIKRTGKADYSAKGDLKYAKAIWDAYNTNLSKNRLTYKFKG
jgi:hypothetical protein